MFRKLSFIALIAFTLVAPTGAFATGKHHKSSNKKVVVQKTKKIKPAGHKKNKSKATTSKKNSKKTASHTKKKQPVKTPAPLNFNTFISQVISQTNNHRNGNKSRSLIENKFLSQIAQEHSQMMASKGKISHDGFSNRYSIIKKKIKSVKGMGENVAMNKNAKSPAVKAVSQWKKSPGHNANMLNKDFRYIGVGIAKGKDGTIYFTQIFTK